MPATTTTTKKKVAGQNLNSLVVKPPPPTGSRGASQKRNGLLVLSSQPKKSGLLATPVISNTPSANASTSMTSTTTELGATAADLVHPIPPDAWGLAAAEKQSNIVSLGAATTGTDSIDYYSNNTNDPGAANHQLTQALPQRHEPHIATGISNMEQLHAQSKICVSEKAADEQVGEECALETLSEPPSPNSHSRQEPAYHWDEYGGRGVANETHALYNAGPPVRHHPRPVQEEVETPTIHLHSYEDRDRGEAPQPRRMLYDPKSGSMVEVKPLEPRQSKKNSNSAKSSKNKSAKKTRTPPARSTRLPRTCGVLYERDESGQLVSKDGCDGDLGYGSHSVPGGRVNNPEAYEQFCRLRDEYSKAKTDSLVNDEYRQSEQQQAAVTLQTGYQLPSSSLSSSWIKADDKLELTLDDSSPTLKPTAKAWAPSQAALAAAAVAAAKSNVSEEDEYSDEGSLGLDFDPTRVLEPHEPDHLDVDLDALKLEPAVYTGDHIFAFGTSGTWGSKPVKENDDWGVVPSALFGETKSASFLDTWTGLGGLSLNPNKPAD